MAKFTLTSIKPVFRDARGSITDLLNCKLGHVGLITSKKGSVRGCHMHKKSKQFTFVLSGRFRVDLAKKPGVRARRVILAKNTMIAIDPWVIHRFQALAAGVLVDMISTSRRDNLYEKDVFRFQFKNGCFQPLKPVS